jgi:hypothetical protein
MTDIVLRDVDLPLQQRLQRIGRLRGWDMAETLLQVLQQGLYVIETGRESIDISDEAGVLEAAISALEHVPNDPGFALIGRAPAAASPAADEPDQSVLADLEASPSQASLKQASSR